MTQIEIAPAVKDLLSLTDKNSVVKAPVKGWFPPPPCFGRRSDFIAPAPRSVQRIDVEGRDDSYGKGNAPASAAMSFPWRRGGAISFPLEFSKSSCINNVNIELQLTLKMKPELEELIIENGRLRDAIARSCPFLDAAAARLQEVLAASPCKGPAQVRSALDAIASAVTGLRACSAKRNASVVPGDPTRQQGQFLAFIREYIAGNRLGTSPAHADFQRFFHLTPPSVNSMLKRLEERGFIERVPGKARAITLKIDPELIPPLDRPFKYI